jgi:hypothetical protein
MYTVWGAIALLVLVVVLTAAAYWSARASARVLGVSDFRWFGARPANAPLWKRFTIRAVSSLAALLIAIATSFFVHITYGENELTTVVKVMPGPAQRAGMLDDDEILSIDGAQVASWDDVRAAVARGPDEKRIEVQRGTERLTFSVKPIDSRIAVRFVERRVPIGVSRAAALAVDHIFTVTVSTLRALSPATKVEVAGPVAIVRETGKQVGDSASLLSLLGMLAATAWPMIAKLHIFAALTLLVFGMIYPEARSAIAEQERTYRIARYHVTLLASLGISLLLMLVSFVSDVAEAELSRAIAYLGWPATLALFPLVWLTAVELWGQSRAHVMLAVSIVPCVVLLLSVYLLLRTRRELSNDGFTSGWFIPLRPC